MRPLLQVESLTKSYGDLVLFDDISFTISEGQRIGLIGANGCGKSTLLSILSGAEGSDSGNLIWTNGVRVGYLPQAPSYPAGMTVMDACFSHTNETIETIRQYEECLNTHGNPGLNDLVAKMDFLKAWDYERQVKQILTMLGITDYAQPVAQLSGGQVKRVALANMLIMKPDFLILDEPTNHMDIKATEWLENYLSAGGITLLMVTHDRYFLDRVCSHILEIDRQSLYQYDGNYSYYIEKRRERIENFNAEVKRANNLYRTELEWMRRQPQARGHKAKYREDAFYRLEKVAKQRLREGNIKLTAGASYIGNKIFVAEHISKRYGDKVILDDFSYTFSRYEKLGILGDNGTGKSTFIKILQGITEPDSGRLEVGETVKFGYYSQDGINFDDGMRVIDAIRSVAEVVDIGNGDMLTASQFLQHFLFSPEKQHSHISKLSGGEKKRLYLCQVLMRSPNFLILDEPTNDLDIMTMQILEEYLTDFKGCVIIVSHDRYFMDKIVDHLFVFNGNGQIKDFPGNYSDYREWKAELDKNDKAKQPRAKTEKKGLPAQKKNENRMTYAEKREFGLLEQEIEKLENEKKQLEADLSSGTLDIDTLTEKSNRIGEVINMIDEKTLRWLELSEKQQ